MAWTTNDHRRSMRKLCKHCLRTVSIEKSLAPEGGVFALGVMEFMHSLSLRGKKGSLVVTIGHVQCRKVRTADAECGRAGRPAGEGKRACLAYDTYLKAPPSFCRLIQDSQSRSFRGAGFLRDPCRFNVLFSGRTCPMITA